jgi:hypothetical protein
MASSAHYAGPAMLIQRIDSGARIVPILVIGDEVKVALASLRKSKDSLPEKQKE